MGKLRTCTTDMYWLNMSIAASEDWLRSSEHEDNRATALDGVLALTCMRYGRRVGKVILSHVAEMC